VLPRGYRIRELDAGDAAALAQAYRRNRDHLAPWEPVRDESFFTERGQATAIAGQLASQRQGLMVPWVVMHGRHVVGRVNLNNIVRGVLRSGALGYWVDAEHLRRGLAAAMVDLACGEALARGLHRVEAGTMVHNVASQGVLTRNGFVYYGTAPSYLFIGGAWQDHHLYQRILHDRPL
jgi:ribosomal-protein-alanine N-acetyltransferase